MIGWLVNSRSKWRNPIYPKRRYSRILRPIEKIVIDANALLSIVIGGKAAHRIMTHPKAPELCVTRQALAEVEEYIPALATRKKLNAELLWSIWRLLPVEALESPHSGPAWNQTHQRDPDDVPTLALALAHGWPIWSQDKDFDEARNLCQVYSTAVLLQLLDNS